MNSAVIAIICNMSTAIVILLLSSFDAVFTLAGVPAIVDAQVPPVTDVYTPGYPAEYE